MHWKQSNFSSLCPLTMPLFLGFLQWQWPITIPPETQPSHTSSSYTLIVVGAAGSSRQCFSLRACLQNQKLISRGLRQSHSLMPNPRESTFPPSFITRFCFTHKLLETSSSYTEQWQLVSEPGCFWCKRDKPEMRLRKDSRKDWTVSVNLILWLNCTPHQDYSDGKHGLILEVWKWGLGIENREWHGEMLWLIPSSRGRSVLEKDRQLEHVREQISPSKHRFYPCNIPHLIFHRKSNISMCTGQLFVVTSDIRQKFLSIVFVSPKGPLVWVSLPANKQQKQLTEQDQWWW